MRHSIKGQRKCDTTFEMMVYFCLLDLRLSYWVLFLATVFFHLEFLPFHFIAVASWSNLAVAHYQEQLPARLFFLFEA